MAPPPPPRKRPEPLFPGLKGRGGSLDPERIAAHQRSRLEGAMVEAAARHGYERVTIAELVGLAGVSKSAFYRHFDSKQDCFLATFDAIVAVGSERIAAAYSSQEHYEERLRAAFTAFVEIVIEEPAAAALVIVESLSLGTAGVEPRGRSVAAFELMLRQSFGQVPERGEVSEVMIRAIVAGIRQVVKRCLREGRPEALRDHLEELLEWALVYQRPAGAPNPAAGVSIAPIPSPPPPADSLGWEEPPNSARSRAELSQRERIVRAAAWVAVESGYGALSIPAISAAAGVSNEGFYEHFAGKEEATLAAFEALCKEAVRAAAAGFAGHEDWAEAVGAGVRGLLEFIAANPLFARLTYLELPTAGIQTLERAQPMSLRLASFLEPDLLPPGVGARLPAVVIEAIGSGMWAVIEFEVVHGRLKTLPEMAPEIAAIALVPVGE